MRVDIITTFPEMMESFFNSSIMGRAQRNGYAEICLHNLRDYTTDKHRKTDDYPFGGDSGMVIKPEPLYQAITELTSQRDYDHVIYTSPDGEILSQPMANSLSCATNIIILCGHYKGIDHRIREHLISSCDFNAPLCNACAIGCAVRSYVLCEGAADSTGGHENCDQKDGCKSHHSVFLHVFSSFVCRNWRKGVCHNRIDVCRK